MIYEFLPKQDLHGYSKPWAPGAGKNLFDISQSTWKTGDNDLSVTAPGYYENIFGNSNGTGPLPEDLRSTLLDLEAGSYIISFLQTYGTASNIIAQAVDSETYGRTNITSSAASASPDGRTARLVTLTEGLYTLARYSNERADYTKVMLESGETAHSYEPYSNICPPQGYDIWDPDNQDYAQIYAGYVNSNTRELYLRPVYAEYDGEELVGPWMSSLDEYDEDATPTEGAFVIDFGGELTSFEITPFMLQTLLDSLGIRQHFLDGASLLNSLMDQAQGRVRSEDELLNRSRALKVIAIGDQLPAGLKIKPISKDVLPGLPGKFVR